MPQIIERTNASTLLGIRFWDPIHNSQIRSGLRVTAWRTDTSHPKREAYLTASSLYAFQGLPGMRAYENATEDNPAPAGVVPFTIGVEDLERRFMSFTLNLDLPLPFRGIYPSGTATSPPMAAPLGFFLFASPNRSASSGVAAIHAWLKINATGNDAAHAVLEIEIEGTRWYGIADERGRCTVLLPFPAFNTTLGASPPTGPAPEEQQWPVTVRVTHNPASVTIPTGSNWPEIRSIFQQSAQSIWLVPGGPPVAAVNFDLQMGRALVLRTGDLPEFRIGP